MVEDYRKWLPEIYSKTYVTYEEKEYITLADQNGVLIGEMELLKLVDDIMNFLEIENVDKKIKDANKIRELARNLNMKPEEDGKFTLPRLFYAERREFDQEKRAWSFKCGTCGQKTGTKTDRYYYLIKGIWPYTNMEGGGRACSPECAQVIGKEHVRDWTKKYKEFFREEEIDAWKIKVEVKA